MAPACSARYPPKEPTFDNFLHSLFFFFPPFCDSSIPAKLRCYCYTPRAQLLSGLIKRSRQFLATVNKSSGQRSLFTPAREFICYALWSSFRSLWKKITERRNKESIAVVYRGFRGVYQLIFDSPAICWIPLKAPRLPEEVACWSNWWQKTERKKERGGETSQRKKKREKQSELGGYRKLNTCLYNATMRS